MEDDNGLELSLGLSFGGLSAKSKGKSASSSDTRADDSERSNKASDEFKNFLNTGSQRQDPSNGFQRIDQSKPKENFFNDLSKASFDGEPSAADLTGKSVFEEEKRAETGGKRRMFFEDMTQQQKKHEREAHFAAVGDINEKTRPSLVSPATDEGSAAENEDVAESEVEGSTSRPVHHHHHNHDDKVRRFPGIGSSDSQKETQDGPSSKRFNNSYDNGFKLGNISYGGLFPGQPINMMNIPNNSVAAMPGGSNNEGPTRNMPLMFGYQPVQIPSLEKDNNNSWGLASQQLQYHHPSSFPGRGPPPNSALVQVGPQNLSETAARKTNLGSDAEEGSSSHAAAEDTGGASHEFSAIKPGILADVKFGGSGSRPNLPWVSTTGQDGRTISGVTYRYNANQIRIVCACHGTHMSPEEFVRHANEDNPDNANGPSPYPNTNPAASAQS